MEKAVIWASHRSAHIFRDVTALQQVTLPQCMPDKAASARESLAIGQLEQLARLESSLPTKLANGRKA